MPQSIGSMNMTKKISVYFNGFHSHMFWIQSSFGSRLCNIQPGHFNSLTLPWIVTHYFLYLTHLLYHALHMDCSLDAKPYSLLQTRKFWAVISWTAILTGLLPDCVSCLLLVLVVLMLLWIIFFYFFFIFNHPSWWVEISIWGAFSLALNASMRRLTYCPVTSNAALV